jgi:hypothetical protein
LVTFEFLKKTTVFEIIMDENVKKRLIEAFTRLIACLLRLNESKYNEMVFMPGKAFSMSLFFYFELKNFFLSIIKQKQSQSLH